MNASITPQKLLKEMDEALKQFGEYPFFDKGPYEVMNLNPVVNGLSKCPAPQVVKFVREVLGLESDPRYRYRLRLAAAIVSGLDDGPWTDEEWDSIIAINPELY